MTLKKLGFFFAALILVIAGHDALPVLANQSPQSAYCSPPNAIAPHTQVAASPLYQDLTHSETCSGQIGDLHSDGPLYSSSFTYSGSSLTFSIPAQVWSVKGQRVFTPLTVESAPASATSYWWLSWMTGAFTSTNTNSPPDSYSILTYTIVANGSGITSVTNPAQSSLAIGGSITADGGTAPSFGFACGTGATPCELWSNSSSAAASAFTMKNSICAGSNLDVLQFYNASSLNAWVGCDGSWNSSGTGSITMSPSQGLFMSSSSLLDIIDSNGPIVAAANGAYPSLLRAGELYTSLSTSTGEIMFGLTSGGGAASCSLYWASGVLTAFCPYTAWGQIQADATQGASPPTVSSGDLSATRSASTGALTLGGSSSSDTIDYGVTNSGIETHSASIATSGKSTAATHNPCSSTSNIPCEFSWSITTSSGTGTTNQNTPLTAVCTVSPSGTLKVSSSNIYSLWDTMSSGVVTVHLQDLLGTASGTISGYGTCL